MSSLSIAVTAWSHCGQARRANDDHYLCGPLVEQASLCQLVLPLSSCSLQEHGFLCAVADGMGGYAGGALASRVVLETLAGFFYAQQCPATSPEAMQEMIETGLGHARTALCGHLRRDPRLSEAGTTLAGLAVLAHGVALPFHLGDSRILRASGGFVRALTVDHTPLAAEIVSGRMSEAEATHSPLASQLTRSFGAQEQGSVEWGEPLELSPGDVFLLGTDGWHGLGRGLTGSAIRDLINEPSGNDRVRNDRVLVRRLVEAAVAADGRDNATLVMMRVTDENDENEAVQNEPF